MNSQTAELAVRYYRDFAASGDFASVPMAEGLRFEGPLHSYADGDRYRRDCAELATMVKAIDIRRQFVDGEQVHTIYDFDLGLPSGPIASSETLFFSTGVMVGARLIIDSTPLRQQSDR